MYHLLICFTFCTKQLCIYISPCLYLTFYILTYYLPAYGDCLSWLLYTKKKKKKAVAQILLDCAILPFKFGIEYAIGRLNLHHLLN